MKPLAVSTDEAWKNVTLTIDVEVHRGWRTRLGIALMRLAAYVLQAQLTVHVPGDDP